MSPAEAKEAWVSGILRTLAKWKSLSTPSLHCSFTDLQPTNNLQTKFY